MTHVNECDSFDVTSSGAHHCLGNSDFTQLLVGDWLRQSSAKYSHFLSHCRTLFEAPTFFFVFFPLFGSVSKPVVCLSWKVPCEKLSRKLVQLYNYKCIITVRHIFFQQQNRSFICTCILYIHTFPYFQNVTIWDAVWEWLQLQLDANNAVSNLADIKHKYQLPDSSGSESFHWKSTGALVNRIPFLQKQLQREKTVVYERNLTTKIFKCKKVCISHSPFFGRYCWKICWEEDSGARQSSDYSTRCLTFRLHGNIF